MFPLDDVIIFIDNLLCYCFSARVWVQFIVVLAAADETLQQRHKSIGVNQIIGNLTVWLGCGCKWRDIFDALSQWDVRHNVGRGTIVIIQIHTPYNETHSIHSVIDCTPIYLNFHFEPHGPQVHGVPSSTFQLQLQNLLLKKYTDIYSTIMRLKPMRVYPPHYFMDYHYIANGLTSVDRAG